ncbi:MAG: hypothetical protein QXG08_03540 [Candidatus Methanomethyliaceae archaeon]
MLLAYGFTVILLYGIMVISDSRLCGPDAMDGGIYGGILSPIVVQASVLASLTMMRGYI